LAKHLITQRLIIYNSDNNVNGVISYSSKLIDCLLIEVRMLMEMQGVGMVMLAKSVSSNNNDDG